MENPTRPTPVDIRAAFKGPIPPAELSKGYQLGLVMTTIGMILLPLVYLGLIWAFGWYFVYQWGLAPRPDRMGRIHYNFNLLSFVFGIVLVLFMVKPIFIRRPKAAKPIPLDMEKEPQLKLFIQEICDRVGVDFPAEVRVDNAVNASAGFRSGIFSIVKRDLVLTIGLPLASGLSMSQLGGVIAHEFGHFAQRASMACTYIIRTVNAWFYRVVYERDKLDVWLVNIRNSNRDVRWFILFGVLQIFIWGTRQILRGLMWVGHVISCYQARQMEFDADYYETQLGGSVNFGKTSRELMYLGAANSAAMDALARLYKDKKLADDFIALVDHYRAKQSSEFLERVEKVLSEEKTGKLDTHPCTRDRIAHSEKIGATGIFTEEAPSRNLFVDFAKLSKEITERFYQENLSVDLTEVQRVDSKEILTNIHQEDEAEKECVRLAGGYVPIQCPVRLLIAQEADDAGKLLAIAREARTSLDTGRDHLNKLIEDGKDAAQKENALRVVKLLKDTGFAIKAGQCNLNKEEFINLDASLTAAREATKRIVDALAERDRQLVVWLSSAVNLSRNSELLESAGVIAEGTELVKLSTVFNQLTQLFALADELILWDMGTACISEHNEVLAEEKSFSSAVDRMMARLKELCAKALQCSDIPYPFEHAKGAISVADYIKSGLDAANPVRESDSTLAQVRYLYYRLIERQFYLAERVLKAVEQASN